MRDSRFCNHCGNRLELQFTEALGSAAPAAHRAHPPSPSRGPAPGALVRTPRVSHIAPLPPAPPRARRVLSLPTPARVLGPLLAAALCFGVGVSAAGVYRTLRGAPAPAAAAAPRGAQMELAGATFVYDGGASVVSLDPASELAKAGLRRGDVVVAVDGARFATLGELAGLIESVPSDRPVPLEITRNGRHEVLTLPAAAPPATPEGRATD